MSFVSSAKIGSIRLKDGHILAATLKRENQQWNDASFDLNSCLGNTEGRLVWGGQSFSHSAVGVEFEVSETGPRVSLGAILKKADGSDQGSMVNLNDRLANINGEFMYIGSTPIPEGVPGGTNLQDNDLLTGEVEIHPGTPPVYKCTVRLCLCIPGFPPHLPHTPFSGIPTFPPTQRPGPDETSLPPERAHGTIMCLPPNDTLCTAFVAMFTEPMGRELRYTARTSLSINNFSAKVALRYESISEASGTHSFGGTLSNNSISIHLDNGVTIMGTVTEGGPVMEVAIAGSGHWGLSR